MIENNRALSVARRSESGIFSRAIMARKRVPVNAARRIVAAMPFAALRDCSRHPLLMWITLWATWRNAPQSLESARPGTDCSNFRQVKIIENQ
jgi:hypothetical protein